ncbi:MAG: leucine-rich repeat protein [Clostridia bacterium]|nr:leucine-rich repeat protein [Clostridia bacterium]
MKKTVFFAILAATICAAAFISVSCKTGGNSETPTETETVNVIFMLDNEIVYTSEVTKGGKVEKPQLPDLEESPFIVWTYNGSMFDFTKTLKHDTVLTATLVKKFSVYFKADGKTIKTADYSYYYREITEPKVPDKKGYIGEWESYETTGGNVTVNAVYTPIVYHVDFYVKSTVAHSITCTIEDYESLIPEVPYRSGYTGKWVYESAGGESYTARVEYEPRLYTAKFYADGKLVKSVKVYGDEEIIPPNVPKKKYYEGNWSYRYEDGETYVYDAIYTPVVYTVSFVAEDEVIAAESYTVEDKNITPPPVPHKEHYDGAWQSYSLDFEDITVNAEYSPKQYCVTFIADGEVIDTQTYTVEENSVTPPAVPDKEGFTGEWEQFILTGGNVTINAYYTAIKYTAKFIADGLLVNEIIYTVENTDIEVPAVPQKNGYIGVWENFELGAGGAVINANYSPIVYTVTFIADGDVIDTQTYTVEGSSITPPAVPDKDGFTGHWEAFTLDYGDKVINAVYAEEYYSVTFIADGNIIDTINYTVNDKNINEPAVPGKTGYSGAWESYELSGGNITVNAIYSEEVYYVYFISDEKIIAQAEYTVTDKNIIIPEAPAKPGYESCWEEFELTCGNVYVNAVFTSIKGTDGLIFTRNGDSYTVTGYKGDEASVIIPSIHEGIPVTAIGDRAFDCSEKNIYTLEEITICENVQTIGENAFYECKSLKRVSLPDSLREIKQSAFAYCEALECLVIPDSVTKISDGTFAWCGFTSVTLPKNLKVIGESAFTYCLNLKEIVIPDSVTEIRFVAFMGCGKLEKVVFGTGLEKICQYAFMNCTMLSHAQFENPVDWKLLKQNERIDVSGQFSDPAAAAQIIIANSNSEFSK